MKLIYLYTKDGGFMNASNSILYYLWLDLRRGLTNKRFWSTLGVLSCIFLIYLVLSAIWPLTTYYYGGDAGYRAYVGRMYTQQIKIQCLTQLAIFANYFPFLGAAAFSYNIIDDRRHGYCLQQIQRIGFSKYYWSKLLTSGLLGGLMGAMCMVIICLLTTLLIAWNPLIHEAVEYYNSWKETNTISYRYVGWGYDKAYFYITNPWIWWVLGGIKYFVMGVFFGLISGIIAFYTNNKVFLYAGSVIFFLLEDKWLSMLGRFFGKDSFISLLLQNFSQRAAIENYGNLYHYSSLIFLIILSLKIATSIMDNIEVFYMEGGNADG